MKQKLKNKIAKMRKSDKKGMEILGWVLTIVLGIAVVGIIWFFVQPAVDSSANDAAATLRDDSTALIDAGSANAQAGKDLKVSTPK